MYGGCAFFAAVADRAMVSQIEADMAMRFIRYMIACGFPDEDRSRFRRIRVLPSLLF